MKDSIKSSDHWSDNQNLILEEYKILVEERRFVATRYMYAVALYFAIVGLSLREMTSSSEFAYSISLFGLVTCLNAIGIVAALFFTRLALHSMAREKAAAIKLRFQPPISHIWGLYVVFAVFIVIELAAIYITFCTESSPVP